MFWYGVAMTLLVETVALIFGKAWLRGKLGEREGENPKFSLSPWEGRSPDRGARGCAQHLSYFNQEVKANELENRGN